MTFLEMQNGKPILHLSGERRLCRPVAAVEEMLRHFIVGEYVNEGVPEHEVLRGNA
jgi:hypothetical protein